MPKKKTIKEILPTLILILIAAAAILAVTIYLIFSKGNPIAGIVLLLLGAAVIFFSQLTKQGSEWVCGQSTRAREAVREGRRFEVSRGEIFRNAVMTFLFIWILPPAFVLLPGQLGLIVVIPLTVVGVLRAAKFYPSFEDIGVPKSRYILWHIAAYLLSYAGFIALKYLVFERI